MDRAEGVTRFVRIEIHASLTVPAEASSDTAKRLLEKAEKTRLVTNSLKVPAELVSEVHSS